MTFVAVEEVLGQTTEWWGAVGNIATVVGVFVALVSIAWSVYRDRSTADRAEAAASLTADNTTRIVEALEAMATQGPAAGPPARPTPRARWSLRYHQNDAYRLHNGGDATAYLVTVTSDPTLQLIDVPESQDVRPDEAIRFWASPSLGTKDMTITVNWSTSEGGEPSETWRYPLPYRSR